MHSARFGALAAFLALVLAGLALYRSYRVQEESRRLLEKASETLSRFEQRYETQQMNLEGFKGQIQENREVLEDLEREIAAVRAGDREEARQQVRSILAEGRAERPAEPENPRRPERVNPRPGRAFLGVQLASLNPERAQRLQYPQAGGALITRVIRGSPAERAGLRADDIISQVNGQGTGGVDHFLEQMERRQPDETVVFNIFRGGQFQEVKVSLGQFGGQD